MLFWLCIYAMFVEPSLCFQLLPKLLFEPSRRYCDKKWPVSLAMRRLRCHTKTENSYDAGAITVLEGLDPVRKRPGMYIGSTGQSGLHHLVYEIVDNSVDEALAGHCSEIRLTLHKDGSVEVADNGRGIPCSIHPQTGKSSLETVLCVLHAGGKFGGEGSGYKVSGGLHGVGSSVVNALSKELIVTVVRDGKLHTMKFARGKPLGGMVVSQAPKGTHTGTSIRFYPDPEIFKSTLEFDVNKLAKRIDEIAYLNSGLTFLLEDIRDDSYLVEETEEGSSRKTTRVQRTKLANATEKFCHSGGIEELVNSMSGDRQVLHPEKEVIYIQEERKNVGVEIALRWNKDSYGESISGFVNSIRTNEGGTHVDGLRTAITKCINHYMKKTVKSKDSVENIPGEFIREGLTAVVSVKVPEPEFEGQTKSKLGNPEVKQIVDGVACDGLTHLFEWQPQVVSAIIAKAQSAQSAALAAKAARDLVRKKSSIVHSVLPGKLADCSSREPEESELFLVEGDSAAGSAKQGRDRMTQAILPLRGKILNIEKTASTKIYENRELQAIISAIGLNAKGKGLDMNQLRYHKIVIMTDADVDGAHIRLLLLTFFYRFQRELIEKGLVYIACPPLYKVAAPGNKAPLYFFDQNEYDSFVAANGAPSQVQRFKGLGEMMPQQLWETTMDPSHRKLKLVTFKDAEETDKLYSTLMGSDVTSRKRFIAENAQYLHSEQLDY